MKRDARMKNLVLVGCSIFFACILAEIVLRVFFSERLILHQEERSLLYRHDSRLGWFPIAGQKRVFVGSHPITVSHNSRGFRDIEHLVGNKPGIVFLGDSFVWGYDVEAEDRFTERLRHKLPGWDVYNLGVSGYGTDQELLLLMDQFSFYHPKLVFLVYCTYNDDFDNGANSLGNGSYFKPYFELNSKGDLELKGVPVPKSLSYYGKQYPTLTKSYLARLILKATAPRIVKNEYPPTVQLVARMNDFVAAGGGRLVVGLTEPHRTLQEFFREKGIPHLLLRGETFPANGYHWTPAGHAAVSDSIYTFLAGEQLLVMDDAKQPLRQGRPSRP